MTLVIPNIQNGLWKESIANKDKFDHIIFLGNYFDSKNLFESIQNFKELMDSFNLDEIDPIEGKVELLLGGNDYQYISKDSKIPYNRYTETIRTLLNSLYIDNILTLYTYLTIKDTSYLFTHAGINYGWYKKYIKEYKLPEKIIYNPNRLFSKWKERMELIGNVGIINDEYFGYGSPLWSDIQEMLNFHKFSPWYQVFGNSQLSHIVSKETYNITYSEDFYCLDSKHTYIIDENGIRKYSSIT